MSNKKNIDRLFQEKFKEFEVKPDPKVWQNIESKLKKEEKDDRVVIIPFWLKLSGIAASLLLFFFLGNSLLNNSDNNVIPNVVDTEKTNGSQHKSTSTKDDLKDTTETNEESYNSTSIVVSKNEEASSGQENKVSEKNTFKNRAYNKSGSSTKLNNAIINNTSTGNLTQNIASKSNTTVTTNKNYKNTTIALNNTIKKDKIAIPKNSSNVRDKSSVSDKINTNVVITDNKKLNENNEQQEQKTSIEDAIAEAKDKEELIEEKEEKTTNRWSVNTNIAPVYYNSFGEGSHLHEQFNTNSKTGEINTSYGVKVGYALNERLTVRSGINKLNLSYDTDDVVVYQKLDDNSSLRNINFSLSSTGQELNIISAEKINVIEVSKNLNAGISQQMSYYEMPLEVEYKLLKKRVGVNIIGGFSTFLLNSNQLTSQLNGVDTKIGEANNINSFSFSTNLGIGIDYKFNDAVVFNLEPTFKYHLNAFNNTSGSFNPYIIGLYTGISYRF